MLNRIAEWLSGGALRPLSERMVVDFDNLGVSIQINEGSAVVMSRHFGWGDIECANYQEGYFWNSDAILLSLRDSESVIAVPSEARGARGFHAILCQRDMIRGRYAGSSRGPEPLQQWNVELN